ncbi:MAG: hypothetical protein LLF96_04665 [Eubacteriales bacterium]|nr:hypothetical protein [Eubacteriales bacterium]
MDVTATSGTWKKALWQGVAFAALWVCTYLFPPLAPFLSFLLPLIVCPAFEKGLIWFALSLPIAPMTAYLLGGGDWAMVLLLPVCPYLCLLVLSQARRRRIGLHAEIAGCFAAFVLGGLGMLARLGMLLGGALFPQLSDTIVTTLQHSVLGGGILYRLVTLGVLAVPDAYANSAAIQLGNLVVLDPGLQRELLNMLRLRLTESFAQWIPTILMQGAVIFGMWTALTTARAHARKNAAALPPPSFRQLSLTRSEQGYMLVLCLIALLAGFSEDSFLSVLSTLTYAAFAAVYQLLGAAVTVDLLSRRHPNRSVLYGVLTALVYLVVPFALFLLGVADQFIHLRSTGPQKPEEE